MDHLSKRLGKPFCLLTAVILVLPGRIACSETGPELFAPDPVLITPTVDPAPRPEESPTSSTGGDITAPSAASGRNQIPASAGDAKRLTSQDGWVTKGTHAQIRNSGNEAKLSSASSFVPPPVSLPGTQARPLLSPALQGNTTSSVMPYPYGTPAPVPEHLGTPSQTTNSHTLPRIIPGGAPPSRSGNVLTSIKHWWNSLWGKKPTDQTAASFGSVNSPYGWTMTAGPNSPGGTPWTTTKPMETPQPGGSSPQIVQPYAAPYALPPRSPEGSALPSLPLTAHPSQGMATGVDRSSMYGSASAGPPAAIPATPLPSRTLGRTDDGNTLAEAPGETSIYGGWSATVAPAPSATGSRSLTSSTLPPYPHYSSGFGAAMPFPSASQPNAAIWNGTISPRQEKTTPPLIDRIRAWWADVTAPKGIQGRQALLPPGPSGGRLLGAGFRGRSSSVPVTDPFSNYAPGAPGLVMPGTSGAAFSQQSPAVLPPPAPQLPLRQTW